MKIDQKAQERIQELESQLEDAYVKIDLLQEDRDELWEAFHKAKGQLALLRIDRRYEIA